MTAPEPKVVFDHTDPEFMADVYTTVGELREKCSVVHSPRFGGFYAVTGHADVADAANDHHRFTPTGGITLPKVQLPTRSLPLESDPPEHGAYRRIIQPFFTLRRVAGMEDQVRRVVVEHIERFRHDGSVDLLKALALPVPAATIAMLLGMPADAWPELKDATSRTQIATERGDAEAAKQAVADLGRILRREVDDRRAQPRDDITSAIVHAKIDGQPIDPAIAFSMVQIIIVAGFDTTVYGIGSLLRLLATRPDLQARVRAGDRALRDHVIEESLRLDSPVFGLARSAVVDTELSGCPVPQGSRLLLCYGAANHDPAVFPEPEQFDPDRGNLRQHLAFGSGRHRCIGEHLAKMEIRVALEELLDRIPTFTLAPEAEVKLKVGNTRGPLNLPVIW
ncbi:cytochrome P450 [Acrocarpospora macrocephala]|uniref:Cytochrome P450 n=1 Tax=Acrocarpospora macrocephala TaxID=150177 RepID=A0A5M3WM67_9ACTN|nr:cytochrome P450 [Acrocarpospora macrocephala]GES09600.1 cytochrome P450 [Acrocarpospora macrocephala]